MKKHFLQVCIVMALLCASLETRGLTLNPFKRSGRVRATSLIVVGNYVEPRLLAEIAQYYSKQPVLVISPDLDGGYQLFFMPTTTKATTDNADQFLEIVKHVNPKRIIVLGNEKYVPVSFVDQARATYSVITLDSDDWSKNATALEEILRVGNLKSNFEDYITNIKAINK